jgi:dTDP-4-amino-4,6-dideoxygalactose transaminase
LHNSELVLPVENDNLRHVYHLFVVKHEDRDQLMKYLSEEKIYCGIHYPMPLHKAEPYASVRSIPRELPVTTRLASQIFSLPMFPGITEQQILRVSEAVKAFSESFVK